MKAFRKILPALLALILIFSMVSTTFAATEITEADTYVLKRVASTGDSMGSNLLYSSCYTADSYYDGNYRRATPDIYRMYDTRTYEIIPTYCTDVTTMATGGVSYRRLNLEDSSFSGSAAGQIRAILTNGFYLEEVANETSDAHEERAMKEVAALGAAAGIVDLTISEAISATQCAIWQAAHGSVLTFSSFVRAYPNSSKTSSEYSPLCVKELDPSYGHVEIKSSYLTADSIAKVNERIRTVYNYLLSLEPIAPDPRIASAASFTDLDDPVFTPNDDGSYTLTLKATVDVDMASNDDLTVKAELGSHTDYLDLHDGEQQVEFTFTDVSADLLSSPAYLSIYGEQTASGFFLFDAVGDRGVSQSMVGMTRSQLPVYAKVLVEENRVLSFKKTTESGAPLEGIVFDIYPAAEMDAYLSGDVTLPEPEDFPLPEKPEYTVITNANGEASLDLTHHGLPDGVYLVVEQSHPAIVAPIAPFYVTVPATTPDGTGFDYTVTLQPKNEVKGGIQIEKDVVKLGNNRATVDAAAPHIWIISATIPEDIAQGKSYVITDTLDNRLDYLGNMKVTLETTDGETVVSTLTADTDYTLTVTDADSLADDKPSDSFELKLTKAGMGKIASAIGTNAFDNYRIRLCYDAQINANAEMGTEIPNQATVAYTNSVNYTFSAESDEPVVYTGAANLLKVDANNNATVLPGATFEVYRTATADEVASLGDALGKLDGVVGSVVKVSFFDNAAMEGEKVTAVTSDENGQIAIYGLAYGDYYLVETAAPAGYNLLGDAVVLTIDGDSHTTESVVTIENVSGTVLPETGGIGTAAYTVSGLLLVCVSVLFLYLSKRKTCNR